jgi:hypothetical protein
MTRLASLALCVGIATYLAPAAQANAPDVETITFDETFTAPTLSAVCGFTVTRHTEGTQTVRTFYNHDGTFARELDLVLLVDTLTANGQTLVGRTTQQIKVTLLADSYTVAWEGTDFRVPVPGAGISFGSVGRLWALFAFDNTLLAVLQDVGNYQEDYDAMCGALSG